MLQLRDVQQSFDAGNDLDEGPERRRALHDAFVHLPHFRLLHDARHHVARALGGLAYAGDRDQARVVDVDLGARLLLNAADRLALRADEIADFVGTDLDGDDARRVLRELRAWMRHRLLHDVEDVHPCLARLLQRLADDTPIQPLDLDVHLDRGDAVPGAGNLEVHVAEMIFGSEDVGEDCGASAFGNQTHRDTRAGRFHRDSGIHQSQGAAAHRGHRGRAIGFEDFGDDADGIRELLVRRQHRL